MRFLELSDHPDTSCHPSNGGELGTYHCGIKFPSAEGCRHSRRGGHCTPPPVVLCTTPPALEPPTQTTFARGPVWRWAFWCNSLYFIPWRRQMCIHMCRWRLYRTHPLGHTLCTNHLGWTRYNLWLCRRTYNPMGMNCSQCPCIPRPLQYNPMDTMLMARRQLHQPAQLPELTQLFVSSSPPLVRK